MKTGWPIKKLGEICEIARGGSPRPIKSYITNAVDGINWIKISDATSSDKYIYKTKEKIDKEGLFKTRMVYPGDFILTNSMSFGRPYIMKTEGAIHDGWLLLRLNKDLIDEDYLYYFLNSDEAYKQFKGLASGAVVQNLNSELVRGAKIILPPISKQKDIVNFLQEKLNKIKETIKLREEAIYDTENILPSRLTEIFENSKNENWHTEPLLEVSVSVVDGTHDTPKYVQNGIPLITSKNLKPEGIDFTNVKYISLEDHDQISKRSGVQNGDLLIAMIGTIGNITIVESESIFSIKNVGLVRPDESKVLAKYIYYYLHNSRLFSLFELRGATQKFISLGSIRSLLISFPDLKTQLRIIKELDELTLKVSKLRKLQESQLSDLKALEQAYLREAFSGDLI